MNQPDHFTTCESTEFGQADGREREGEWIRTHTPNSRLKAKPLPELEDSIYTRLWNGLVFVGKAVALLAVVGFIYWRFL